VTEGGETVGNEKGQHQHRSVFQQRLAELRRKLLDLSNRNRLISFKHSDRARTHIRVVDELPDVLFARLSNGQRMRFKPLPEPEHEPADEDTEEFLIELEAARATDEIYKQEIQDLSEEDTSSDTAWRIERALRNRVREKLGMEPWVNQHELSKEEFARLHGIEPAHELPKPFGDSPDPERHLDDEIQTLHFPREMDRKLNGIVDQARTMAQEAGVSTLRAAFGFLEWREAHQAETKRLSPLMLLPVEISRKSGRPWRHFDISGEGSEVETNRTLALRLKQDFGYELPAFQDEDSPESFLARVEESVAQIPNWRVRRFVTIGNFGFSKLAMYTDLDPELWEENTAFAEEGLVWKILMGENRSEGDPFDAPDYEIDSPTIDSKNLFLVTDADASQHSAIIDTADGKNLVIKGPPGTGKSQTITNIIAASIVSGKKVLFVAEKMAALEVVSSRLDASGLGEYCMEVHSSKTSKISVRKSISRRLDLQNSVPPPADFTNSLEEWRGIRDKLNAYVTALNECVGALGLSVQQILWGARRSRDDAGAAWELARDAYIDGVLELTPTQRNHAQDAVRDVLTRLPTLVAGYESLREHQWGALGCKQLTLIEQEDARAAVSKWRAALQALAELASEFSGQFGPLPRDTRQALALIADRLPRLDVPNQPVVPVMARALADPALRERASELLRLVATGRDQSAGSEGLILSRFPDTDRDWEQWCSQVRGACAQINSLVSEAETIDEAVEALAALREKVKSLSRLADLAEAAGGVLSETSPEITVGFAVRTFRAACLIEATSEEILLRRQPPLFDDAAIPLLSEAATRAKELSEQRQSLDQTFSLKPLPSLKEADHHHRSLRAAGALGAFSKRVREAKRFFRSISLPGVRAKPVEMAQHLARLAAYLDGRTKLASDARLAQLCGNWFDGPETRFDLLMDVQRWGRQVQATFPATDQYGSSLRNLLLQGPYEHLEYIAEHARAIDHTSVDDWLESVKDESVPFAELVADPREKVADLEDAIGQLHASGFGPRTPLSVAAKAAESIGALNELRFQVHGAVLERAERSISLLLLANAFEMASELVGLDFPAETAGKLFSDDVSENMQRVRDWCERVKAQLEKEAECRSRAAKYIEITKEVEGKADGAAEGSELGDLIGKLDHALSHPEALGPWVEFLRARRQAADLGIGNLIEAMVEQKTPVHEGIAAYNALVYRLLSKAAFERFPYLSEFDGLSIEQARERFQTLDKNILTLQKEKIQSELCHLPIPPGIGVGLKREYTELALIRNELSKNKKHLPLRELLDRAGGAIQRLKPCMMMSPLSVATYLKPGSMSFDLLVVDEASQMPPEDAIGALLRAGQCVIVGDPQQLPPTPFFRRFEDAMDIEDEEESEDLQIESILEQAYNVFLPPRQLRWHYRSRHESLIAFSNKHFYENRLTVFPSPREKDDALGVKLVPVNGRYADRHNPDEARAIANWAADFMHERLEHSLGIVAVNQLQRDLINDEMERLLERDAHVRRYIEYWEREEGGLYNFFVKNLENVQGDERDVIAISTVYGSNADGRVMQNFGPVSQRNGHRRLNVLFTRAREQVVLFSSLKPEDIQLRETTGQGPRILRNYLDYARTGRLDPGNPSGRLPDSDFEIAVANRLVRLGYEAVPQVGVAGFFIDLAVRHPDFPGTFLVGVECDGATYHSAKSARDRDRLREEVLKGLGWTIYRIWSTDWFRDPDGETEKLRLFIEQAASDRQSKLTQTASDRALAEEEEAKPSEVADTIDGSRQSAQPEDEELPLEADQRDSTRLGRYVATTPENEEDERPPQKSRRKDQTAELVQVGDSVTFHFVDGPENKRTVTIVLGASDVGLGVINAYSPVGKALLDAAANEEVEIHGPQGARTAIIDEIGKASMNRPGEAVPPTEPQDTPAPPPTQNFSESESKPQSETVSNSMASSLPLGSQAVVPYRRWEPRALPDPREANTRAVARHLREIIETEGPIRVHRAFRLYAQACGVNRIGRVIRSELNKALHHLVKKGDVLLEHEGADETQISAVARVAGTPKVIVRHGAYREFWDIPPSELAAVMKRVTHRFRGNEKQVFHRVLAHYGITRLTSNISKELQRIRNQFLESSV